MVKVLFGLTMVVLLSGCEQQYRYFCHDPNNWNTERCQKPICEINRDCPEHILKGVNGNGNGSFNNTLPNNNSCQQCTGSNQSPFMQNQRGANK